MYSEHIFLYLSPSPNCSQIFALLILPLFLLLLPIVSPVHDSQLLLCGACPSVWSAFQRSHA